MENLICTVEHITYHNSESGYSVIRCKAKNYQDLITVVGNMPDIHVGSILSLGGQWRVNPKYGEQFVIERFEETLPATSAGIEKYLGSGLVKGIGPKFARRIVQRFGADTLDVIEQHPDKLREVKGIGGSRIARIIKSWTDQKEIKNIMLFLQGHDVSPSHATKIYKTYGNESIQVVQENPYRLADDIWGIGFRTADTIAKKLGFADDAYYRLRSGLLYTLNTLSNEGHCYATRDMLQQSGAKLLSVEEYLLSMTLDSMIHKKDVILETIPAPNDGKESSGSNGEQAIYLPPFYFAEVGTAKRLATIQSAPDGLQIDVRGLPERIQRQTGMTYDEVQMKAILTAVQNKVMVLTGGPGTGKSATTLGIVTALQEANADVLLAAPTGRAAKRLSEATGMEAKTIHRMLEYKPPEGYQRNEDNPLDGDVLILDEASMIDIMLMNNLMKAIPSTMKLILVGDVDQLPSVGAGNVLLDIIHSGCVPVVRLTRIFRQAQTSKIITNAHRINSGKMPDISNDKNSDFFFIEQEDPDTVAQTVVNLVKTRLPKAYNVSPADIQVLAPMRRGVVGSEKLNWALQEAIKPGNRGLSYGAHLFKTGDKVMQIRDNYDKDVFNGDIGMIEDMDVDGKTLRVNFDGRTVDYDISELDELKLAYVSTIHKAQGAEYPIVVMPILMNHYVMLQRNLIYTGVTRAKKLMIIVGTKKALSYAIRNVTVINRNTMLKERLQGLMMPKSRCYRDDREE